MKWDPKRLAAAAIIAAGLAAYADSFSGVFILDDQPSIVDNPTIRHLADLKTVLTGQTGSGLPTDGRPLLNLSLAVNYAISGTHVWSYHAANIAIHILAGLALFGIARRTLEGMARRPGAARTLGPDGPVLAALAVALLWVLHPLQTESITYIVQRAESLMGLFYLLTLYCFIRGAECSARLRSLTPGSPGSVMHQGASCDAAILTPCSAAAQELGEKAARHQSWFWFGLSWLACLFGMASKEVMVSAPLIVCLYDRTFVSGSFRKAWQEHRGVYIGLASSWLLLGLLVISTNSRGHSVGFGLGVTWYTYALTQFYAVAHYLRLSFWPHPLVFDYGSAVVRGMGDVAPQMTVIVFLFAATLVALLRWPAIGFCGAWFFAILAPTSTVVPVATQTVAEHRMYLPLAAVVALVVAGALAVAARRGVLALLAIALGLGFLTARRNADYHSAVSIWNNTLAQHPESWRAQSDLGIALAEDPGRLQEALAHFEEALRINPDSAQEHLNLATVLVKYPDRVQEAISHYETALRIDPNSVEAHFDLAIALADNAGRAQEAIAHYNEALRLRPDFVEAHNNLAILLARIPGREEEAIAHYKEALRLKPDYAESHYNLAFALARDPGRRQEAIAHYEQALRIRPGYAEAHFGLAAALAEDPARLRDAIAHFEEAVRLKPDFTEAHVSLANVLAGDPARLQDAIAHYESALRLQPDYAEVHYNLANVLATDPARVPEAISHYEQALKINPDYAEAHINLAIVLARDPRRLPEVVSHFESAVRLQPDSAEAQNNLANALVRSPGRLQEAVSHYEQALKIRPDYADAHCNIAVALARMGRADEAIAHLEAALRINPDLTAARNNLARLRAKAGR
jgi:tetratricopeptide (TPR) repeat protein